MAAPTWRGAVEIGGIPINVTLHNRIKSKASESFKMLGSDDKPVRQVLVESAEAEKLAKDPHAKVATVGRPDTRKGVEAGPDTFVVIPSESIEAIGKLEKSTVVQPTKFVPVDDLPFEIGDKALEVLPDEKVPGAEGPVGLLWHTLRDRGSALMTQVTMRAGSRDAILAIYARDDGLFASTFPFADELNEPKGKAFDVDAAQADLFGQLVDAQDQGEFDLAEFNSTWRQTRDKAIKAAMKGKKIEAPKTKAPAAKPDLMAALEAAVKAPRTASKKPAKKGGRKKVTA